MRSSGNGKGRIRKGDSGNAASPKRKYDTSYHFLRLVLMLRYFKTNIHKIFDKETVAIWRPSLFLPALPTSIDTNL